MEILENCVYEVSLNNVHIQDSYKITSKSEMAEILYAIQHKHPECNTFKRNYKSLIAEWRAHNRLYKWGYETRRTGSVDLNYPLKWYVELAYRILGI